MFTRNSDSENSKSSNNDDNTSSRAKPIEDAPKQAGSSRETVISNDLTIHGNVTSEGIVRLEGTIIGDMNCTSLVVENDGSISGNISAKEVKVHGRVGGTVHGANVMLHSSAFVEGDIYHQGIGIDMGAQYDGRLQWVDTNAQTVSNPQAKQETHQNVSFYAEAAE